MTPVVATVLLAARRPDWRGLVTSIRATTALWVVGGGYVAVRGLLGLFQGHRTEPYAISLFGGHVVDNMLELMRNAALFGLPLQSGTEASAGRVWPYVFWFLLIALATWAAWRGAYLPVAGIVCFFMSLVPLAALTNHYMDVYYVDLALVGLAVTVGALVARANLNFIVVVSALFVFVLVQAGAVQLFQERTFYAAIIERTDFLEEVNRHARVRNGQLVVETPCRLDKEWARDGELFRVLRDDPDLRVRFRFVEADRVSDSVTC
jgi:hypothetical protein